MKKFILSIICLFGICYSAIGSSTFDKDTGIIPGGNDPPTENQQSPRQFSRTFQDFPPNEEIYTDYYINELAKQLYQANKSYTDSIDWQINNYYPTTYVSNTIKETISLSYAFDHFGLLRIGGSSMSFVGDYPNSADSAGSVDCTTTSNEQTLNYHNNPIATISANYVILTVTVPYDCLMQIVIQAENTSSAGDFTMVWQQIHNSNGRNVKYMSIGTTKEKFSGAEEILPITMFAAKDSKFIIIPYTETMYDWQYNVATLTGTKYKIPDLSGISINDRLKNSAVAGKEVAGSYGNKGKLKGVSPALNAIYKHRVVLKDSYKNCPDVDSGIPSSESFRILTESDFNTIVLQNHAPHIYNGDVTSGYRLLPRRANGTTTYPDDSDVRYWGRGGLVATIVFYPLAEVSHN